MIPLFLIFLFISEGIFGFLPLLIFAAAAITDTIDGRIARRDNLITDFGKFMDPLADKLLTASAFIAFIELGYMSSWIVILILSREFLISGFRALAASSGITIAANAWGKFKTVFQMVLIIVILMFRTGYLDFVQAWIVPLEVLVVVLTVISGATYIYDNREVLK
jgi:CDP-diacylglycerol--glycerol-3-phosphate 3-phosphatidyltransferase